MQDLKSELVDEIWNKKEDYYKQAAKSHREIDKIYTYKRIKETANDAYKILDVGCGEGSVLGYIKGKNNKQKLTGIDISSLAINTAKSKHPQIKFMLLKDEELPFFDNNFDLTFTTYTLEHLINPLDTINEMIRVTGNGGYCIFLCPNYGSPIYASPCYKQNKLFRLIKGFFMDIKIGFSNKQKSLGWENVEPIIDKENKHYMDHDTTIEPYLLSLKTFIERNTKHKIIECSSQWDTVNKNNGWSSIFWLLSLPFKFLGKYLGLYPFKYWGPTLF